MFNKGLLNPYGGCSYTNHSREREGEGEKGEGGKESSPGVDRTASDFLMSSEP